VLSVETVTLPAPVTSPVTVELSLIATFAPAAVLMLPVMVVPEMVTSAALLKLRLPVMVALLMSILPPLVAD